MYALQLTSDEGKKIKTRKLLSKLLKIKDLDVIDEREENPSSDELVKTLTDEMMKEVEKVLS